MLLKQVLAARSPAGAQARLSTLIFHRVLPAPDPLFPGEVCATQFDAICRWIKHWFNVLPLDTAARLLREGALPARAMAVTFDDGYADNHDVAAPILLRHGLPCTFFVVTGFSDGGRMWNDTVIESVRGCPLAEMDLGGLMAGLQSFALGDWPSRRLAAETIIGKVKYLPTDQRLQLVESIARFSGAVLPNDLMMTRAQVRSLHGQGFQVGAHTVSHPILKGMKPPQASAEIVGSKVALEEWIDAPVTLFAYPNGKPGEDYEPATVGLVREAGFDAAVSTEWGVSSSKTDPFQLRRFTPWDRSKGRFWLRLLTNLGRH